MFEVEPRQIRVVETRRGSRFRRQDNCPFICGRYEMCFLFRRYKCVALKANSAFYNTDSGIDVGVMEQKKKELLERETTSESQSERRRSSGQICLK